MFEWSDAREFGNDLLEMQLRHPDFFLVGAPKCGTTSMSVYLREHPEVFMFRLNTKTEQRPPMNPALRRRLQAEFRPEVERLSDLLQRDLTYWCEPPNEKP